MDKKTKIQIVITGVLIVILLCAINNARITMIKSKELTKKTSPSDILDNNESPSSQVESIADSAKGAGGEVSYKKLLKTNTDLSLSRDPFSYRSIKHSTSGFSSSTGLSAILWNKDQSLAVINHKVVKKGDQVGHNTIIEIRVDRIIFNDGTNLLLRPAVESEKSHRIPQSNGS
jgi:hypothetical protein